MKPFRFVAAFLAVLISLLFVGCGRKNRMVIFLVDETASASANWEPTKSKMAEAAQHLWPGDRFVAVAIDDKAYDPDEIRLDVILPTNALLCQRTKNRLIEQIQALEPRESSSGFRVNGVPRGTPQGTDILGAIDVSSKLCEQAEGRTVFLCLCSDLADPPRTDTQRQHPIAFPPEMHFTALFVGSQAGGNEVEQRIGQWGEAFGRMGLSCTPTDFHLVAQSKAVSILK